MIFYVGLHDLHHAHRFERAFLSVNRLRRRKGDFQARRWIMDSAAFTELFKWGGYRHSPEDYAAEIDRWRVCGEFEIACAQDYMCEPFILEKTGLSVREHQRLTIDRFRRLRAATAAPIMPVLQGYRLAEYLDHLDQYGGLLQPGDRVGVGSVCKRNSSAAEIEDILGAIRQAAPALRLHGFRSPRSPQALPC